MATPMAGAGTGAMRVSIPGIKHGRKDGHESPPTNWNVDNGGKEIGSAAANMDKKSSIGHEQINGK